jgi:hypothetical protein
MGSIVKSDMIRQARLVARMGEIKCVRNLFENPKRKLSLEKRKRKFGENNRILTASKHVCMRV